jgi:hypothetical protein
MTRRVALPCGLTVVKRKSRINSSVQIDHPEAVGCITSTAWGARAHVGFPAPSREVEPLSHVARAAEAELEVLHERRDQKRALEERELAAGSARIPQRTGIEAPASSARAAALSAVSQRRGSKRSGSGKLGDHIVSARIKKNTGVPAGLLRNFVVVVVVVYRFITSDSGALHASWPAELNRQGTPEDAKQRSSKIFSWRLLACSGGSIPDYPEFHAM